MTNSMPKRKKKSKKKDYLKIAKALKGKTGFNIDLRKTNNTLSRGQKSALTKAFNELKSYKSLNYVELKKLPGESKKDYKERARTTKNDFGQKGSFFKGVYIDTPDYTKQTFKRVKNNSGKWTTQIKSKAINSQGTEWKEIYIPIGSGLDFALDPDGILDTIRETYKNEFAYITPNHSGFRGKGGDLRHNESWNDFKMKLRKWANQYAPIIQGRKNERWLSGFYLETDIRQIDRTPTGTFKKMDKRGRN